MRSEIRARIATGIAVAALTIAVCPETALAQAPRPAATTTDYDELYWKYLATARSTKPSTLWMADLAADPSARRVNDLLTIRVIESLSATGSADSDVAKASNANVSFPSPLSKAFEKFLPTSTDTKFKGAGTTTRTTELTATLTARVVEVLPNGNLVVEGVREVDINGDRSVVVLSGVVRPADVLPGNVVPSTSVGQLRIRSLSQGLIHDSLAPGWLVRIINKVF
jgi:flagellar L-ring protein precursor FlgH